MKKKSAEHTVLELAEAIVYPVALNDIQKNEAAAQLLEARKKSQAGLTEMDRLKLQVLQFKFQLEDYIENKEFHPGLNFGFFLKQYIDLLRVKQKAFAEAISIDESLLSQFIHQHRMPPEYIVVRLEIHSNNAIPATHWFKLVEKQRAHELKANKELRKKENRCVRQKLLIHF